MQHHLTRAQLENIVALGQDLLQKDPSFARIAIPFLHLLNAHPNHLKQYQAVFNETSLIRKRVYNLAARLLLKARSLKAPVERTYGDALPENADILIVSHFLRKSDAANNADLYYGKVPGELEQAGVKTFTALINHSKLSWSEVAPSWQSNASPRAILPRTLSYHEERDAARLLKAEADKLQTLAESSKDQVAARFYRAAAIDAGSPGSRTAIRIGRQIGELVSQLKPKLLITTFEGHSWERLAFANARIAKPGICCVGYHHAVLFPMQTAMLQSLDPEFGPVFDPDYILTAGDVTKHAFEKNSNYQAVPILTFGSCRGSDGIKIARKPQQDKTCLVLPEGLISESLALIELAIKSAKLKPDVHFTIRLHPLITPEKLEKASKALKNLPDNMSWSTKSLEQDCKAARWAIYRGSSAILSAVLSGVQPIYYTMENPELSIDPMKTLESWRVNVENEVGVVDHINKDLDIEPEQRAEQFEQAKHYCLQYFTPLQTNILRGIMEDDTSSKERTGKPDYSC